MTMKSNTQLTGVFMSVSPIQISSIEYKAYINIYAAIMANYIIYENEDINIKSIKKEFEDDPDNFSHLTWENMYWSEHSHVYEPKINFDDKKRIRLLTRAFSEFLPYVVIGKSYKYWDFDEILEKIFLTECYIEAIYNYAKEYSRQLNDNTLLKETEKIINDEDAVRDEFFNF